MLRTLDVILIAAMIGAATVTYQIKHKAEGKLEEVRRLQAEIKLQENTIDLLKADWSLLNQPSRLERLVEEYADQLQLETIEAVQMAPRSELPGFPVPDPDQIARIETPDTTLTTGSVQP